jgi:hypothetical protein
MQSFLNPTYAKHIPGGVPPADVPPTPTPKVLNPFRQSWADITEEEEKEYVNEMKAKMTALPAGLLQSMAPTAAPGRKGRRARKKEHIVSLCFNDVASRPLATKRNTMTQITCHLRIDLSPGFTSSTVVPVFLGQQFNLGQFNGTAAYAALFDQYRFDEIEAWIEPTASYLNTANAGILTTAVDLDDANTPASVQAVEDKQSAISSNGMCAHYHKWKPHVAVAVYSGAFTSFGNAESQWIDIASNTVQHYGLKCAITVTNSVQAYNITVRAKVSFRQPGI